MAAPKLADEQEKDAGKSTWLLALDFVDTPDLTSRALSKLGEAISPQQLGCCNGREEGALLPRPLCRTRSRPSPNSPRILTQRRRSRREPPPPDLVARSGGEPFPLAATGLSQPPPTGKCKSACADLPSSRWMLRPHRRRCRLLGTPRFGRMLSTVLAHTTQLHTHAW